MKNGCRFAAVVSAVALLSIGTLLLNQNVSAAGEGKITGTIKLDGAAPHMKGIDMSKDPVCAKANAATPARNETVLVGPNGGIGNVVLYISEGLSGAALTQVPSVEPVFDQKGCIYKPHVLVLDVSQKFKITTSDETAHNIHPNPNPMTGNIPWNQSQPPGAAPVEKSWKAPEFIPVQCNIHPWMHAWYAVVTGPYATSDENGNFTINNVPPGNYTVTAWQEEYGKQTAKVTVAASGAGTANFTFKPK
jgi:hypothetical protein